MYIIIHLEEKDDDDKLTLIRHLLCARIKIKYSNFILHVVIFTLIRAGGGGIILLDSTLQMNKLRLRDVS